MWAGVRADVYVHPLCVSVYQVRLFVCLLARWFAPQRVVGGGNDTGLRGRAGGGMICSRGGSGRGGGGSVSICKPHCVP